MQSSYENINTFTHTQRYLHLLLHFPNYIYSTFMLITGHCRGTINFPSHKHTFIFLNKQKCQKLRVGLSHQAGKHCRLDTAVLSAVLYIYIFFFFSEVANHR